MLQESDQRPDLIKLYKKYNRENTMESGYLLGAGLTTLAICALALATTPSSLYDENLRPIVSNVNKWVMNIMAMTAVIVAETGVGFVGWRRSQKRKQELYSKIAQAEGREVDETNEKRIMYTAALASTLVYGIQYKPSKLGNIVNTFVRPVWEMVIPYTAPEDRKKITFDIFDKAVETLFFDEWTKREIGLAALNLGRQRWEAIKEKRSGNHRLRGYSYAMVSEINRRLGDSFPPIENKE